MKEDIIGLFVDENLENKRKFLLNLFKKNKLEISKEINKLKFTPELALSIKNIKYRFYYLKNIHEFRNEKESNKAMKIMEEHLNEIKKIKDIKEKIILLKYVAVHSDKEISKKAINLLASFLDEILLINNDELKASTLRYLFIHSNKSLKEKIYKKILGINNKYIRNNSLDYINKYFKN